MVAGILTATVAVAILPAAAVAAGPPPGRAFELVSPVDDPGGVPAGVATDSLPLPGLAPPADDDRVIYGAVGPIGETESGATNPFIFGRRTPTGWTATTGMRTTDGGETGLGYSVSDTNATWVNDGGTDLAFVVGNPLGPPHPPVTIGASRPVIYRLGELGPPEWLSAPAPGGTYGDVDLQIAWDFVASRDLQTVAFRANVPLIPGAPSPSVYVVKDGQLQLAGILPGGGGAPTVGSSLANGTPGGTLSVVTPPARVTRNLLTRDGRYLVFRAGANVNTAPLYVRDLKKGLTHELAPPTDPALSFQSGGTWRPGAVAQPSERTVPPGFVAVAASAPVAFFRSGGNLASGATGSDLNKVYEVDLSTGDLTFRKAIDGPPLEVSPNGRRVMFLRPTGASTARWELRFWDADDPDDSQLLGSISGATTFANTGLVQSLRTSKDGGTWVFTAAGELASDVPNAALYRMQVFRWQVGEDRPTCLSCDPVDGQARLNGASLSQAESGGTESLRLPGGSGTSVRKYAMSQRSQAISDDGRLVAFDSPDQLVAEDTNLLRDVYLWDADAPDGKQLRLLTSGKGTAPSYYIDMSPDGKNVFFSTQDGLVPADKDLTYDVYVARRGGGFAGSPESCTAESCRPPVVGSPVVPVAESPLVAAVSVGAKRLLKPQQEKVVRLRVRRGKASTRRVTLKVRTPGAGTIRARGNGLRTVSRKAKRSATYTVRVSLSKRSRRTLARKGRLRLRVAVRFTPRQGKAVRKAVSLTIKRSVRSSRKGR